MQQPGRHKCLSALFPICTSNVLSRGSKIGGAQGSEDADSARYANVTTIKHKKELSGSSHPPAKVVKHSRLIESRENSACTSHLHFQSSLACSRHS
eukprot:1156647-Pelagomonas_calceolata.AAC.13